MEKNVQKHTRVTSDICISANSSVAIRYEVVFKGFLKLLMGRGLFFPLWLKTYFSVAHGYNDFYSFECTQNQLYMFYKISKIVVYVYKDTDKYILTGNNYFSSRGILPSGNQASTFLLCLAKSTKSAKRKKLKQRRQPSGTRNAISKLLKQHQL